MKFHHILIKNIENKFANFILHNVVTQLMFYFTEFIELNATQPNLQQSPSELRVIHKHDKHDTHDTPEFNT